MNSRDSVEQIITTFLKLCCFLLPRKLHECVAVLSHERNFLINPCLLPFQALHWVSVQTMCPWCFIYITAAVTTTNHRPRGGRGMYLEGGYLEFQVTEMIKWGQKMNP